MMVQAVGRRSTSRGFRGGAWRLCSGRLYPGLLIAALVFSGDGASGQTTRGDVDPHAILARMATAYNGIHDYTALFLKRERVNGTMPPLEKIDLRFQEPFKLYMAWQEPYPGRVITYIAGQNNNKILVNPGGGLSFLRLSLDPTGSLAMRNAHHTVLQAGLENMISLIMKQYQRGKTSGEITLKFHGHDTVDGRPAYHLEWIAPADKTAGYYAYRGEIWIDKEYYLPTRMYIYNWDNQLYEHYEYHRLHLNPGLDAKAFTIPPVVQAASPPSEHDEVASP